MATKKTKKKAIKKTQSRKPAGKKTMSNLKRTTKKMVDDILLKVSPTVEKQIDQLTQTLEKAPNSVGDLKLLGLRVLQRAKNLSASLRKEAQKHKRQGSKS